MIHFELISKERKKKLNIIWSKFCSSNLKLEQSWRLQNCAPWRVSELAFQISPEVLHVSNGVSFWQFDISQPEEIRAGVIVRR